MDPFDCNFAHSIHLFGSTTTTGRVLEARDLVASHSGVAVGEFNQSALKQPGHKLERTLDRLEAYYQVPPVPFRVHLLRQDAGAAETLLGRGYVPGPDLPCMVFDAPRCEAPAVPGLELRGVRDAAGLADFGRVAFTSFSYPVELAPHAFTPELMGAPQFAMFLGYLDGAPVCCSAIIATGRVAGIYWVGCLATHRQRGLGAAITAHAVQEARALGAGPVCLQASVMGAPVYKRLGFRQPRTYQRFDRAAAAA